ncbi:hypothetical protein BJV78DRAFT_1277405 [Lactifluus subvellereus]|nr:hypothetical protein BJV78DRAFT_1277405 [Lactifluus subvellereus]
MHLVALNIPDLLLGLWRGTLDCDSTDHKDSWDWAILRNQGLWKAHGKQLVWGFQIMMQEEIMPSDLIDGYWLLIEWSTEFEMLYCQRREDRIHMAHPSLHTSCHVTPEALRHSTPFANLAQRGVQQCQVNALLAMMPDLHPQSEGIPQGGNDLGDGYILLPATERSPKPVKPCESTAIHAFLKEQGYPTTLEAQSEAMSVTWSAHLRLPNGQTACSLWKECTSHTVCVSQHVKFENGGQQPTRIAEVMFFFLLQVGPKRWGVALVSLFGPPSVDLLRKSNNTYYTAQHLHDTSIKVIDAKCYARALSVSVEVRQVT